MASALLNWVLVLAPLVVFPLLGLAARRTTPGMIRRGYALAPSDVRSRLVRPAWRLSDQLARRRVVVWKVCGVVGAVGAALAVFDQTVGFVLLHGASVSAGWVAMIHLSLGLAREQGLLPP